MRITKINIPKEQINNGLEPVKMHRLGQIVLLAGKNGAGKTRLLNLISNTIGSKPKKNQIDEAIRQLKAYQDAIEKEKVNIENYKKAIEAETNPDRKKAHEQQVVSHKTNITSHQSQVNAHEKIINWNLIETDQIKQNYTIIPFVPKSLDLKDCNNFRKSEIISNAQNIDKVGVNQLANGTFARIQVVQDRWFNATHQESSLTQDEKDKAVLDYEKLKDLIHTFLNTTIERSIDGEPTLFGFPLGQSNLSDGQKILLQLCLAIHCQQETLDDLVLFLDEPENHLHPSVIIQTIERIKEKTPNGQIWISTHSIPLLSYFDPSNIWFVEKNRVSYAGTGPEKVLNSLLGGEDQIGKLQDFISLPGVFALHRHAFESLFHPEAVTTDSSDPQTLQIRDEVKKHLKTSDKIRVLDYGAGKGRLLANILDANKEPISKFKDWFDYVAYDKFDFDKAECISTIERISSSPQDRYFNSFPDLFGKYDKESFDIIIMCNVLHEIDPNDWLSLFSSGGVISDALTDTGILLIVEDQEMPIGEKAYQKGFIVLNTAELKDLFKIKEEDTDFGFSDARENGRLKAHRLKKEYLERIDAGSKLKALESLHKTASEKIIDIRNEEVNYKNGKLHGFWVQQFANTGLALKEIK
ncbi:MAG: AAA family ATPase [Cyclobacteriaceae bacterium]